MKIFGNEIICIITFNLKAPTFTDVSLQKLLEHHMHVVNQHFCDVTGGNSVLVELVPLR